MVYNGITRWRVAAGCAVGPSNRTWRPSRWSRAPNTGSTQRAGGGSCGAPMSFTIHPDDGTTTNMQRHGHAMPMALRGCPRITPRTSHCSSLGCCTSAFLSRQPTPTPPPGSHLVVGPLAEFDSVRRPFISHMARRVEDRDTAGPSGIACSPIGSPSDTY